MATKIRPKIVISGYTAYPREIDFKRFGEIAKKIGAFHVSDIAHISGLVVAGLHPSPVPHVLPLFFEACCLLVVKNGSKIRSKLLEDIPSPVSSTRI